MHHTTLFSANGAIYAHQARLDSWDWSWAGADLLDGAEKVTAFGHNQAILVLEGKPLGKLRVRGSFL